MSNKATDVIRDVLDQLERDYLNAHPTWSIWDAEAAAMVELRDTLLSLARSRRGILAADKERAE